MTKINSSQHLRSWLVSGEKLGMNLRVAKDGRVLVVSVIENGAADRASDPSGNSCPVRAKDEIAEINGVSLTVSHVYQL